MTVSEKPNVSTTIREFAVFSGSIRREFVFIFESSPSAPACSCQKANSGNNYRCEHIDAVRAYLNENNDPWVNRV